MISPIFSIQEYKLLKKISLLGVLKRSLIKRVPWHLDKVKKLKSECIAYFILLLIETYKRKPILSLIELLMLSEAVENINI